VAAAVFPRSRGTSRCPKQSRKLRRIDKKYDTSPFLYNFMHSLASPNDQGSAGAISAPLEPLVRII